MACCSSAKTEQLESKRAETVKAFAAGANAFLNSPGASHPRPLYLAALRFVHNHLRRRSTTADSSCGKLAHFECTLTFWIWDVCSSRRAVSCAILAQRFLL
jgi:hypothetical protein